MPLKVCFESFGCLIFTSSWRRLRFYCATNDRLAIAQFERDKKRNKQRLKWKYWPRRWEVLHGGARMVEVVPHSFLEARALHAQAYFIFFLCLLYFFLFCYYFFPLFVFFSSFHFHSTLFFYSLKLSLLLEFFRYLTKILGNFLEFSHNFTKLGI